MLQPHWPAALGNRAHTLARVQSTVLALLALAPGGDVPAPNSVYNIYFLRGVDRASGRGADWRESRQPAPRRFAPERVGRGEITVKLSKGVLARGPSVSGEPP